MWDGNEKDKEDYTMPKYSLEDLYGPSRIKEGVLMVACKPSPQCSLQSSFFNVGREASKEEVGYRCLGQLCDV